MAKKTFQLTARVSTENPKSIQPVLEEVLPKGSVTETDEGFLIQAKIVGESARELNKALLSALRRVGEKDSPTIRMGEWEKRGALFRLCTEGEVAERFDFKYLNTVIL